MNKFYENYKDLFVDNKPSNSLSSPIRQSEKKDWSQSSPNRHYIGRNLFNTNPMNNQFKRLFNQYETNDANYSRLKTQQSPAGKQLKQIILPKIQFYDKQIQHNLKRFKTQAKNNQNHLFLYENRSCLYPETIKQKSIKKYSNKSIKLENFSKYKYGPKISIQKNAIDKSYQLYQSQNQIQVLLKAAGKPSKISDQQSSYLNPENLNVYQKNKSNIFKLSLLKLQNQTHNKTSLQTEYQRSYSNKKIRRLLDKIKPDVQTFIKIKQNNQNINFHQIKDLQTQNQKPQYFKNINSANKIKFKSQQALKNEEQSQTQVSYFRTKTQKKQNNKKKLKRASTTQQGIKFSQYQNQYAFINKRLQDIQYFNNYYTHNYINSYKKAIMRRIDGKKNQESRKNKLRYLLLTDQLSYQNSQKKLKNQQMI